MLIQESTSSPKPLPPPWDRFVPFVQKVFVWALFFAVLWFLRSFFFLVFLTFVFGYVMEHAVDKLEPRIRSRRVRVVVSFLGLLGIIVGLGFTIGPSLGAQARSFPGELERNIAKFDAVLDDLRRDSKFVHDLLPQDVTAHDLLVELGLPVFVGAKRPEPARPAPPEPAPPATEPTPVEPPAPQHEEAETAPDVPEPADVEEGEPLDTVATDDAIPDLEPEPEDELLATPADAEPPPVTRPIPELSELAEQRTPPILPFVIALVGKSVTIGGAFLLALLFSFLIVFDLPNLARGARHLHDTRMRFIYDEVSGSLFRFGRVLGQALEAQLMIAIVNTSLTAIGLTLLRVEGIAFLSAIVFVCSFIPVAGVFISSVPICLAALTAGGPTRMLWAIAFITFIHMVEAYILNPRIYGAHLRMNPVLVLAILVMSHHLFGVWGLILGVPVVNFFVRYVIEAKEDADREVKAA